MTKYKKAIEILKNHDTLDYYKTAMAKMSGFVMTRKKTQQSIANLLDQQRKEEIEKNRRLLVPIVQTLVFCGRNVLLLRGHRDDGKIDEAEYVAGEGIFRGLLRFRRQAGYKNLEELLAKPNAKLISKTTQNELLFIIGAKIQENIVVKIKESIFFSVLMDETQDVSCKEQATVIIRYVEQCGKIAEEFIGFNQAIDLTGQGLSLLLKNFLKKLGLNIWKCRGQGCDGAAAMMGKMKGCATLIQTKFPLAFPVHCFSHRLNLVLSKSCQIRSICNAFSILSKVCDYIKSSTVRTQKIEHLIKTTYSDGMRRRRLITLSPTRWVQRHDAVIVFIKMLPAIAKFLSLETDSQAKIPLSAIQPPKFVIGIKVSEAVMVHTIYVSELLQKVDQDLGQAYNHIHRLTSTIKDMRCSADKKFHDIFIQAQSLSEEIGGDLLTPRTTRFQVHRQNLPARSTEENYRKNDFIPFVDCVLVQLEECFGCDNVAPAMVFQELMPGYQCEVSCKRVREAALLYIDDIGRRETVVVAEIERWFLLLQDCTNFDETFQYDLACSIRKGRESLFPSIEIMLRLFGTLPVTTASAERSFSSLKRLKTYLRSTNGEERLNAQALLACNPEMLLDTNEIINRYAQSKNGRILLQ